MDDKFNTQIDRLTQNLDWNLLRTFMVVVQEGGITKGAERLSLCQPTISQAIKRLEDRLDVQLIERSPSVFRITPAGRHLYQECVDIYGTISRALRVGQGIEDELTGTVVVAAFSRIESDLFDQSLEKFHAIHPKVCFQIDVMSSKEVRQAILEKRADVGFCLIYEKSQRMSYELFYRNYFGFFCGPTHPLYGKKNLKLSDLRGHSSVTFKTDQLWDALRPVALMRAHHKLDEIVTGYTSHLGEAIRMIISGLGFGPIPVHVAEKFVQDGRLWRLPPYDDSLEIDVYFITNPKSKLNIPAQRFIEFFKQTILSISLKDRTYRTKYN